MPTPAFINKRSRHRLDAIALGDILNPDHPVDFSLQMIEPELDISEADLLG